MNRPEEEFMLSSTAKVITMIEMYDKFQAKQKMEHMQLMGLVSYRGAPVVVNDMNDFL